MRQLLPLVCPPRRGAVLVIALSLLGAAARASAPVAEPAASLEFIQNKGQWDSRVQYAAPLHSGRLFMQADGFTYSFLNPADVPEHVPGEAVHAPGSSPVAENKLVAGHAYTVRFAQANPHPRITAEVPTTEVRNYFVGNDARRWAGNVRSFRRLRYAELWPGIAMQVYENRGQKLEYDFLLAPRANPARVALRYEGADHVSLDAKGNLLVKTSVTTVTELAPRAWQTAAGGQQQPVPCRYVLTGSTVTFALGAYDHSRPLTIDPVVVFSSYTGATTANWGYTATYDLQGNLYSGGIAFALGFPATNGAFSTAWSGLTDIAIMKFNTAVSGPAARVWATYLGGSHNEYPQSIVTNARGELVVLGSSSSQNYPTTSGALSRNHSGGSSFDPIGGPQFSFGGGSDLVVTRFNATGSLILASTYLGGSGNDGALPLTPSSSALIANYGDPFRSDLLLDGAGNVFIASNSNSSNFPGIRGGGYHGGTSDGILCKLTPSLNAVAWSAYIGGTGADAAYSVQVDGQGRVFVSGGTNSAGLSTPGAYQPGSVGGVDGFVARYSAAGALEAACYVGTDEHDQAQFLQLDAAGNAYVFGQTQGVYPRTPGLVGSNFGTLFVHKFNADLTTSIFSTALGGPTDNTLLVPTAFLVDDCERVYISGWGGVTNGGPIGGGPPGMGRSYAGGSTLGLPTTANALRRTSDGSDFYVAQFNPGMTTLDYGSFFGLVGTVGNRAGADHVDGGTSRFDKRGVVYQAVCGGCETTSAFPVPPGANTYINNKNNNICNNAAFKIDFQPAVADPGPRRYLCYGSGPVQLGGNPAGGTWAGPGVRARAGGGYEFDPQVTGPGQHFLTYTVATAGVCQATLRVRYLVAPPITPTIAPVPDRCQTDAAVALTATPAGGTWSGPGISGSSFSPQAAGAGTHTISYTISDSLGCGTFSRQVVVAAPPIVRAGRDTTLCASFREPFQLTGQFPAGGTWSGPGVTPGGFFTPPNTNYRGGVYALTYTVEQLPCRVSAVRTIVLAPASSSDAALALPVCEAAPQWGGLAPFNCPLTPVLIAPNARYEWDFGDGSPLSTEISPNHVYAQPGTYRIRLTARYATCEVLTQFAPLEVGDVFVPNVITPNGDQENETFRPRFSCKPASLTVFSRWGQQVFATENYANNWRAENLAAGLYYYLLKDSEGRTMKGWVEVMK